MYTPETLIVCHGALLTFMAAGSADARFELLAGNTLLASLPIDTTASAVHPATGVLTLEPGAPGVGVGSGTVTRAMLVGSDDTVIDDAVPVEEGINPVLGRLVLSSMNVITGGTVTLIAASIG